ncbi:MAG: P-loop NTPase [Desulfobacterales bacterium]|nr:P-loop NTPase [Desulfobacterales bacterium]
MICGKGGSGKSTVSALLAGAMAKQGRNVLLMDADESNIGLYRMLGVDIPRPLMDGLGGKKGFQARQKSTGMGFGGLPPLFSDGMTLDDLPQNDLIKTCLAESGTLKILATGKIHHFGEGCACPMGKLFRMFFTALKLDGRDLVIVDTAAGLEHFGRRLDGECDHILTVVEPSYESVTMARRMAPIAGEAGLPLSVILNKTTPDIQAEMATALEGLEIIGCLPRNSSLFLNTLKGLALAPDVREMEEICLRIDALMKK